MNCIGPPLSETPRVPRFLRQRLALQLLCRTGPAHRRSPSFTTPARSIPSGHQSRAMATFGLITCVSPSSAHTHPKLDSYQESYQAWRHAPGQPALKGFSYSHAGSKDGRWGHGSVLFSKRKSTTREFLGNTS